MLQTLPTRLCPLGNGSQVVVAADGATGIVYLGFSASDATLQLMLNPVTSLEPVSFLDNLFQDGPPAVSPHLQACPRFKAASGAGLPVAEAALTSDLKCLLW